MGKLLVAMYVLIYFLFISLMPFRSLKLLHVNFKLRNETDIYGRAGE